MEPKVAALYTYPLKSAQCIALREMSIDQTGPLHDREWMLINKNNSFVTQRSHPQLSQIKVKIESDYLVASHETHGAVEIPLHDSHGDIINVEVFQKPAKATLTSSKIDQWFSDFLNTPVRLVRSPKENKRQTSGNHGPRTNIHFADGYPLLLTNVATLKVLNERLGHKVTMLRFRPNIVIDGAEADAEDGWQSFEIDGLDFLASKACSRCSVIDVDPETGKKSKSVSRELKSYRVKGKQIVFGVNLTHLSLGTIKVGDSLENIKLQSHI